MKGTFELKGVSPYIYDGIIGHTFRLSLWQRIKLLFYQKIDVVLMDVTFNTEHRRKMDERSTGGRYNEELK